MAEVRTTLPLHTNCLGLSNFVGVRLNRATAAWWFCIMTFKHSWIH